MAPYPQAAPLPPPPPSGPLPWQNERGNILGICITLTVAAWLTYLGRIYARLFVIKKPWWDDVAVTFAVLWFTLSTVTFCVDTNFGAGKHVQDVSPSDLQNVVLCQYIYGMSYAAATAFIKISLLLQYLRIYEKGTKTWWATNALLVLVSLWGFIYTFISIFNCFPSPSAFWHMTGKGCYGFADPNFHIVENMIKGHSGVNFLFDTLVFLLAVRLQFLKGAASTRWSMTAILGVGLLACAFALWRLVDAIESGEGVGLDPTYNEPGPLLLSTAELYLAVSCATIPLFWPAILEQFSKISEIFVKYEVKVSSDSRVHLPDEEIQLTTGSLHPDNGSWGGSMSKSSKPSYGDVFLGQDQVASWDGTKTQVHRSGTTTMAMSDARTHGHSNSPPQSRF